MTGDCALRPPELDEVVIVLLIVTLLVAFLT